MNQDEDKTIQKKLTPGTCHGRVIRHEHNEVSGQIILIEDREYFFPCLLYTSPSPRDTEVSRMPSSA